MIVYMGPLVGTDSDGLFPPLYLKSKHADCILKCVEGGAEEATHRFLKFQITSF